MSNALNKKTTKASAGSSAEIFTEILARFARIYVLLMVGVFPLFATDMYYNILKDKFYFFFYATVAAAAVCLVVILIGVFGGALRKQKDGTKPLAEMFRPTLTDLLFLAFLVVAAVSTFGSEWVYESFWGNNGRLQGLFFYLIVAVAWIIITRFYRFRMWNLYVFLGVGIIVCLWGVLDFLGVDPFGWRGDANDFYGMLIFTSSQGNVNTFTAVAAVYMGAFAAMNLREKTNVFCMIGFFIAALSLITGLSDNAILALGGVFALMPFYVLQDRKKIGRYLILVALLTAAMAFAGFLVPAWTLTVVDPEYIWGALVRIAVAKKWLFVILSVVFAVAGILLQRTSGKSAHYQAKPFLIAWGGICVLGLLAIVCAFIDVNTAGKLPVPEVLRPYFYFNDEWGTKRGFAWRATFEFFGKFNPFKKLFGSGPETYAIAMAREYYYEMLDFMGSVFDSPHSEPLQYLFTTGILGFLSFYSMSVSGIIRGVRKGGVNAVFAFAAVAYLFASIINISTPVSTPYLFLSLALAVSVKEYEEEV